MFYFTLAGVVEEWQAASQVKKEFGLGGRGVPFHTIV